MTRAMKSLSPHGSGPAGFGLVGSDHDVKEGERKGVAYRGSGDTVDSLDGDACGLHRMRAPERGSKGPSITSNGPSCRRS